MATRAEATIHFDIDTVHLPMPPRIARGGGILEATGGIMPRITTHAIPLEIATRASGPLIEELSAFLDIPREHFALEVRNDPFVRDGDLVTGDPFVEVALFDRGAEAEDRVARAITRHLQNAGCPHLDLYLQRLERHRYYEDGEPF
jgi:hypothetical protein